MATHPRVRQYLNIKRNRGPGHGGAVVLEGLWAIRGAAAAGLEFETVFVCRPLLRGDESAPVVDAIAASGASVLEVGEATFHRMVDRDGPDGLAAVARVRAATLADIEVGDSTRLVVADAFELAGNLGTLIRCADGAGAAAVLLTDRRLRVTHPLVVKASMATVFTMPVVDVDRESALAWLRGHRFRILGADPAATLSYRNADYSGAVAIVLGSERHGLAPFWRQAVDVCVAIPMLGVADSLNVGHAAALLLYEALHQARG